MSELDELEPSDDWADEDDGAADELDETTLDDEDAAELDEPPLLDDELLELDDEELDDDEDELELLDDELELLDDELELLDDEDELELEVQAATSSSRHSSLIRVYQTIWPVIPLLQSFRLVSVISGSVARARPQLFPDRR